MKFLILFLSQASLAAFLNGCGKPTFSSNQDSANIAPGTPLEADAAGQTVAGESKKTSKAPNLETKKDLDCSGIILHGEHESCDIQDLEAEKEVPQPIVKSKTPAPVAQSKTAPLPIQEPPVPTPTTASTPATTQDPPSAPATVSTPATASTPATPATPANPTTPAPAPAPTMPPKDPNIVEFKIKAGTGMAPWNTAETMVTVKVGQTLRLINDDTVNHRLHTGGSPCPHGTNFAPGQSFDCVVTRALDPAATPGRTYDHIAGQEALFHLKAVP